MAAPWKFDTETRERAVRMYREYLAEVGGSKLGARKHVGSMLGINLATLRNWIEHEPAPREQTAESAEVKRPKREIAELRRANEILETASAFFAAVELDRRLS